MNSIEKWIEMGWCCSWSPIASWLLGTCLVVSKLSLFQDVPQAIQEFSISALCAKAGVLIEQRIKFFWFEDTFGMSTGNTSVLHNLMADKMIILDASGIHFMYRYRIGLTGELHTLANLVLCLETSKSHLYSQQLLLAKKVWPRGITTLSALPKDRQGAKPWPMCQQKHQASKRFSKVSMMNFCSSSSGHWGNNTYIYTSSPRTRKTGTASLSLNCEPHFLWFPKPGRSNEKHIGSLSHSSLAGSTARHTPSRATSSWACCQGLILLLRRHDPVKGVVGCLGILRDATMTKPNIKLIQSDFKSHGAPRRSNMLSSSWLVCALCSVCAWRLGAWDDARHCLRCTALLTQHSDLLDKWWYCSGCVKVLSKLDNY